MEDEGRVPGCAPRLLMLSPRELLLEFSRYAQRALYFAESYGNASLSFDPEVY